MKKYTKKEIFLGNFITIVCGIFMSSIGTILLIDAGIDGLIGIIMFYGMGIICFWASIRDMINKIKYNKNNCHEIKVLLVEDVIKIIPENIDLLYEKLGIDREILENESSDTEELYDFMKADADKIDKVIQIKDGIDRYLIEFIEYGKIKNKDTLSEELAKSRGIKTKNYYITSNDKFNINQLYSCDIKKYGVDFDIEKYKDKDFEWFGINNDVE